MNSRLREKNQRMKARYLALLDLLVSFRNFLHVFVEVYICVFITIFRILVYLHRLNFVYSRYNELAEEVRDGSDSSSSSSDSDDGDDDCSIM